MKSNNLTYKNDFDLLVADPFVYRWLGKYYLFGTGNYCPIYESSDLINWSYLGTAIPPNENNVDVLGCYAPEVVYFGGLFYLIYSPKGNEHRIYCSKDLTCNYTACDNVFEGIDGSFFVEKNGVTIFRSADVKGINPDGIYYKTSPSVKDFDRVGWKRIPSAYLNGWTEGPFLFERKDYKYLTYTGNHYLSEGYRVDYVSGLNSDYSSYNEGDTILVSTDKEYNGLGHSATVIGPNLDSLIITYHNLLPGKKGRHYNFSTLITDENRLFCNGLCNYSSSVPLKPDFESRGINLFRTDTNKLTIPVLVDGLCTAELSFRHHKENFLYFGNYTLSLSNGIAKLFNNKDSYTSSYTTLPENCVIVVRIVNGDGQLKIYVNSQEEIVCLYTPL